MSENIIMQVRNTIILNWSSFTNKKLVVAAIIDLNLA